LAIWPLRRVFAPPPPIKLALQGGGAHGAYTWGVLDALLERERDLRLGAASGASAGAMNAVALAHGLLVGGARGAREALARFWYAVADGGAPFAWLLDGDGDGIGWHPAARAGWSWATQHFAPAQFNPMDLNPLRDILRSQIDFERLRGARSPLPLFIAATEADSGRLRLFGQRELSAEVLLASACLPTLHHTVTIDGRPYWDGAYSANPALAPLVFDLPRDAGDATLMVLLSPLRHAGLPVRAEAIRERTLDIAFAAPFLREARLLAEMQQRARATPWLRRSVHDERVARQQWHLIDGGAELAALRRETRLIAHRPLLERLRDLGRAAALAWLDRGGVRAPAIDLHAAFVADAPPA
jgi:NTE family protein